MLLLFWGFLYLLWGFLYYFLEIYEQNSKEGHADRARIFRSTWNVSTHDNCFVYKFSQGQSLRAPRKWIYRLSSDPLPGEWLLVLYVEQVSRWLCIHDYCMFLDVHSPLDFYTVFQLGGRSPSSPGSVWHTRPSFHFLLISFAFRISTMSPISTFHFSMCHFGCTSRLYK